jgi:hypothetical protein
MTTNKRTTKAPEGLTDQQRKDFYAEQRAARSTKLNAKAGLPADADVSDLLRADAERATQQRREDNARRAAAIADGTLVVPSYDPFEPGGNWPRRSDFPDGEKYDGLYHAAARERLGWMMGLSDLKEAYTLNDDQLDAMEGHLQTHWRELREVAVKFVEVNEWLRKASSRTPAEQAAIAEAFERSDAGRAMDALVNPTPAQLKSREQQRERNARRDPAKVIHNKAKKYHQRALESLEAKRSKLAYMEDLLAAWPNMGHDERYDRAHEYAKVTPQAIVEARQAIDEALLVVDQRVNEVEAIEAATDQPRP